MKRLSLLTAILLLSAAWAVAQSTPPSGSSGSAQAGNSSASSIEGCLAGSAGNYTLTDASGKTYQLQGDTSKLSDEVGHQVRIHGTEASAGMGASGGAAGSSSASSSSGTPFNVTSVKKVADTCSNK